MYADFDIVSCEIYVPPDFGEVFTSKIKGTIVME